MFYFSCACEVVLTKIPSENLMLETESNNLRATVFGDDIKSIGKIP